MQNFNDMHDGLLTYVNSTMSEFNDLGSDLYESMIDMDYNGVQEAIKSLKKVLNDIQRSYQDESNSK